MQIRPARNSKSHIKLNNVQNVDTTHGMFSECMEIAKNFSDIVVEEIRKKQRLETNYDCFAKAYLGYCNQISCAYYNLCMEMSKC